MELAQHRRTCILEAVDQRDRPQRACPVTVLHLGDPGDLEYPAEVARFRRRYLADVEVEIEVRVALPPWRRRRRRLHHTLPAHTPFSAGAGMWKSRSKSGSLSRRGGAGGGDSTTRCRNIGSFRLMRSIRSRTSSQFGDLSSSRTVTTLHRSRGTACT